MEWSGTTGLRLWLRRSTHLADVQLAISTHGRGHELVATTLVTVCGADEQLVLVVVLALGVLLLGHVKQGACCIAAICEPSLGPGRACTHANRLKRREQTLLAAIALRSRTRVCNLLSAA